LSGLQAVIGFDAEHTLVVKRSVEVPGPSAVPRTGDIGGGIGGFKRLAKDKQAQQFARPQLDHAGKISVPAADVRFRVFVDDVAFDQFDHWALRSS